MRPTVVLPTPNLDSQPPFSVDLDLPVLLPDEDQVQAATIELYGSFLPLAIMMGAAVRIVYSVVRSPSANEAMVIMELDKSAQKWHATLPERCTHLSSICCRDDDANNSNLMNVLFLRCHSALASQYAECSRLRTVR